LKQSAAKPQLYLQSHSCSACCANHFHDQPS
jgi:hypothetical protein